MLWSSRVFLSALLGIALLCTGSVQAQTQPESQANSQIAPSRTWPELKAETQRRADNQLYPLIGLDSADVAKALARIDSLDRDQWGRAFSAVADQYAAAARAATPAEAPALWHRAWRLYDSGRWPTPNSPAKLVSQTRALEAYRAYAASLSPRLEVVRIPFDGQQVVAYLRLPLGVKPAPLVIVVSALDSRKEDAADFYARYLDHGIGILAMDMPGTGENPAAASPESERVFAKVLDWVATRPEIDAGRVIIEGTSWAGYWSSVVGTNERARLRGAVVQGGPVHFYFTREWQLKALKTKEYLFDLFAARAALYRVNTLDEFLAYGPKMSLLTNGMIDQPSAPVLVLNGVRDTQVPIEDLDLLLRHGSPTWGWVNPDGYHTGRGGGWSEERIFNEVVLPWVQQMIR